jgi:hypothetical protein
MDADFPAVANDGAQLGKLPSVQVIDSAAVIRPGHGDTFPGRVEVGMVSGTSE